MKPIVCAWCATYRPGRPPLVVGHSENGGHGMCSICRRKWQAEVAADPNLVPKASPCCGFIGKVLPGERFGYEWRQCGCGHIYIVRQPAKSS
jgi:hypothetical protein